MNWLNEELTRYVRVIYGMMDPIIVQEKGIDKLNETRAYLHRKLCDRYKISREDMKQFTDNLPTQLPFEECCKWLHNALTKDRIGVEFVSKDATDNSFLFTMHHDLFYLFGTHVFGHEAYKCYEQLRLAIKWGLHYTANKYKPGPVNRNAFTKAYRCCIYLAGLPATLQPSDEIMQKAAIEAFEDAIWEIRHNLYTLDFAEEYKPKN